MKDVLNTLASGQNLSREAAKKAMDIMISGAASDVQIAAILGIFAAKNITVEEVVGFATSVRQHMVAVKDVPAGAIDVCGTGGDGSSTLNISTATAFVLAGGGVSVAKHGNRSVSSKCGGFDVLEALDIQTEMTATQVSTSLNKHGIGFMFAPLFHPAFKHVAAVRKELGVRTVFNLLGPLCNPAGVSRQLLGVYDARLLPVMAQALCELGSEEALVVASEDGLDELSLAAKTQVAHVKNGHVDFYSIDPTQAGLQTAPLATLQGGDAAQNARTIENILQGKTGAPRNVVVLNAAAGFVVAGKADTLQKGARLAEKSIDSGAALAVLNTVRQAA